MHWWDKLGPTASWPFWMRWFEGGAERHRGELQSITESCCFPVWWLAFQTLLPLWFKALSPHTCLSAIDLLPSCKVPFSLIHPMEHCKISSFEWTASRVLFLPQNPSLTPFIYRIKAKLLRPAFKTLLHAMSSPNQPNSIFTYLLKWDFCAAKISFTLSWPYVFNASSVSLFHTVSPIPLHQYSLSSLSKPNHIVQCPAQDIRLPWSLAQLPPPIPWAVLEMLNIRLIPDL